MSVQLDSATRRLREMLLAGCYPPGARLREVGVAQSLGVSRTIARLAMSAMEHEGLLTRERNRGFAARGFTIAEIADAIEVRGELEAMAARLAAERGLPAEAERRLDHALAEAETMLAGGIASEACRRRWAEMNADFHRALVEAAQNRAIAIAIGQMLHLPLVAPAAIIFDRGDPATTARQLARAHGDHRAILEALRARQGHRAEALTREHAFRSAQNRRRNLADPAALALARQMPGGGLIVAGNPPSRPRRRRG